MNIFDEIEIEVTKLFSPAIIRQYNFLPLKKSNGKIVIALPDKNNKNVLSDIEFDTGLQFEVVQIPQVQISYGIKKYYPSENNEQNNDTVTSEDISDYSTVEYVNKITAMAIESRASDIHIEPLEKKFRVRYRIDGHLREISVIDPQKGLAVISRIKIMSNLDISEKRRPQDGKIRFSDSDKTIDIRVSTLPTSFGEKAVLRILDKSHLNLDISGLGISEKYEHLFRDKIKLPYGMILVTGPTGSGKTTTLYAALKEIYSVEKNIQTVEDPIEYNIEGINQCNVKSDIGFDFANALRAFLRQDPDVVMVGEIRDRETAEIAIRASLTGHLVFSTLHTNDSVSCIARLVDMGIEPFLVASSVKLVVAQRLVRVLCDCKIKDENDYVNSVLDNGTIYKKKGCEKCNYLGYKGRTAIFEFFEITEKVSDLIIRNESISTIRKEASENGFKPLRISGLEKVKQGITSYEEVLRETMV